MEKVSGKVALVAGGAGGVGEGIVLTLIREGATVIVPSRSPSKIARLREYVKAAAPGRLDAFETDISDPESAETLREEILTRYGTIDILVASLGGWWQGAKLVHIPMERWRKILQDNLTSHFVFARTFLPVLLDNGSGMYVQINGFSAETPYPNAAPVSIAAAATLMMGRSLGLEHQDSPVRIHELILGQILTRARRGGDPEWYYPTEVGDYIVDLFREPPAPAPAVVHHLLKKVLT